MTKVFARILELFEAEGINTIFGIPDPNFVHMFHLAEERGWNVVAPHHEESAGFMAEAVSRMTGKAAVCIGTLGPGVANLAGAMMCAKVENSPVVFLGGQRARITEQRVRRGRIQFVKQAALFEPSVKYSASIEYADQTDEVIREGLRKALSGTPGPVYIEYPSHVIQEDLDVPPALPPEAYRLVGQTAGPDKVAEAVAFIRAAKQPILLVGHGVHTARAGESVRALAEAMACPVIQTSGGTSYIAGLEDRTFPYGFSAAAIDAVVKSDLCLAIGTELGEPVHYGRGRHWVANEANRRWILVEQDPQAIGVNRAVDVPLVGDLRAVVPQLVDALEATPRTASPELAGWITQDAARLAELAETAPSGMSPVHPARLIVEATKVFPKDGIMVRDGGATTIFGWTYSQAKPHDVMWNQNFGHLGTGLPYAIGASVAEGGKRPLMLITGDSSFQFHIAELETAARLNLPLVCVVGVDYAWGLEVGVYKRTFGQGSLETGVHWSKNTRLDKVAEGFGCHGEYVERDEDIAPAVKRAYASGRPGVVHVAVDPKANSEEMPSYDEFRTWYAEGTQ
ncbi:thiamine pyrophosphate-binding protein [Streptomyces sp. RLB3-17]|uniref:thiamine pyrophosphate-binding protein n=1 Tax=unclassified Streptomyces TaxID=2593676 RepID=UPI0011634F30|nr:MULTISPECIES: thiamine pyrophosphate-binding protein [unclassified Streptomyces]QDN74342.1 thiamine pyrophosphate-binding protein [Streptomyces sp. S1A1-7]QDN76109.1 thiamine pyrophosphate-binding protein [Streptomyces sp. S1A1-7]QDN96479.1 thiamine pyrophosphate-binding protein [Streptomyces sp. RLB1-9]QDO18187.1 thiamine pyrophosphate-binding protein [Streptomyces sp. S1A1-8]QDO28314.1 thiamine pyrophosphate-binding protein [Streptomyces sp. S1A1-3]